MPILDLTEIIQAALRSQVIAFPTDTVPALAVSPAHSALIFSLKKRSADKPLILMAASAEDLWPYVLWGNEEEQQIWQEISQKYWPGQLTLVLPASAKVPAEINPLEPTTIGIRVPNHAIAQKILSRTGALATTSANLSGEDPLLTAEEIAVTFPEVRVLESIESNQWGTIGLRQPSTVARWNSRGWDILRQGQIVL